MMEGCYTAIVTPFKGNDVDYEGFEKLLDFQIQNGISGIVAAGTTGESPTLSWTEHKNVIEISAKKTRGKCLCVAGTGSNSTEEALEATKFAAEKKVDAVLIVDPYYNGPSSLEIRKEYLEPIASTFPNITIIPYVIPGRTGTQLFPEDIAICYEKFKNVNVVKEATGNIDNMRRTRELCGNDFSIISGDDGLTLKMITDDQIKAGGVISVISNIIPKAVTDLVSLSLKGNISSAKKIWDTIEPLTKIVSFSTSEPTPFGNVLFKARNPLSIKAMMDILGMPSGGCRKPMGKLTKNGFDIAIETLRQVYQNDASIFKPIEDFFGININERLNKESAMQHLYYEAY
ncbi:MAG: 4-hydroxy-tetrahydrodipicolinate synthase [Desulfobacterales bacterium]|nr:4-hydroxy-tetrahydrodipicolinate synthase [Desulfobacterales bacterium]